MENDNEELNQAQIDKLWRTHVNGAFVEWDKIKNAI